MKADRTVMQRALCAAIVATASLGGCASVGPQPWEHDLLAKKEMQLNPNPNLMAFDEHIYFSKEGSSGGRTYDGGGCGCN
ncbi:MAG TPA: DUF4266 domain-containing protein [Phototrophicaceae bacterium]|nr:DUF4266 domain-containing protein [Phototrophicaceae bacterium]